MTKPVREGSFTHTRLAIDPSLSAVLTELQGTPRGERLVDLVLRLSERVDPEPTEAMVRAALAPHLWFLDRATGGGIPLTQAGYLKPADVRELAAQLPTMSDWIFPVTREVDADPVWVFRSHLLTSHLLRKYKGTLLLTRAGRDGLTHPLRLWAHVARSMIPRREEFVAQTAALCVLEATARDERPPVVRIAETMTEVGWRTRDGRAVFEATVYEVWRWQADVLGNVGRPTGRRGGLSPEATRLVRDALFTPAPDDLGESSE